MTDEIYTEKNDLRAFFKAVRMSLSETERNRLDRLIADRFLTLPQYREAKTVLFYVSLPLEVDTYALMERAFRDDKTVAAPRCVPGTREMDFYILRDIRDLAPGAFGVSEPKVESCEKLTDLSDGLCVVPALGFARDGYRLGYGKGYYDRFLARFSGRTVGLVYDACLKEHLPHDRFDCRVEQIVTENQLLTIDGNQKKGGLPHA